MQDFLNCLLQAGENPSHALLDDIVACGDAVVPHLIAIATDEELIWADSDSPQVWAPTHAIRLLGQLHAIAAIEPLIALLEIQEADWMHDEVPNALAQIGLEAVDPLKAYISDRAHLVYGRSAASGCLIKLVAAHPRSRQHILDFFRPFFVPFSDEVPDDEAFRGLLIADLLDIKAKELYPEIEAAYLGQHVDENVVGLAEVQKELRIRGGAKPRQRAEFELQLTCTACGFDRPYAVDSVYYDEGTAERQAHGEEVPYSPFIVPRQVVCSKCGAVDQYKLSAMAHIAMMAELLKLVATADAIKIPGLASQKSHLHIMTFTMQDGKIAHPLEAVDYYRQQIERYPKVADYHLRLANVLRFLGRWEAAQAEYQRALELDPTDASPLGGLAGMADLQDDDEAVILYAKLYLERVPRRPRNWENAALWDQISELYEHTQQKKKSWPARLSESIQDGVRSLVAPRQPEPPSKPVRSSPPAPNPAGETQAQRKKRDKRKSARKSRKGKRK